jgi:hypothetical protein
VKRLAALLPLTMSGAFAQCVMCFRTAAAQQSERARVLNAGIIIMLIPPLLILGGFVLLFYVRRKTYADAQPEADRLDMREVIQGLGWKDEREQEPENDGVLKTNSR